MQEQKAFTSYYPGQPRKKIEIGNFGTLQFF